MKIICISDTHNKHSLLHNFISEQKDIDILIHSGDGSNTKEPYQNNNELRDCLEWLSSLKWIKHKIYVPGNHDTSFERGLVKREDFKDITFLNNEETIIRYGFLKHKKLKIYGSPVTPSFGTNWAYNCKRGKIDKYWQKIPNDVDFLITHGPPYNILDSTIDRDHKIQNVGCKNLLTRVLEKQPKYHIFGHVHDEFGFNNHGIRTIGIKCKTTFINASIVNLKHQVVNDPIVFKI